MIILLHNIRSSHNVGSIFRTADAAGCEQIYLCGVTPHPTDRFGRENTDLIKVSLGAENVIKWQHWELIEEAIVELKKQNYKIFALEQSDKSQDYRHVALNKKDWEQGALLLGDEVRGLSTELLSQCDQILEIPMAGQKESLNVAVAFGVAIFELRRQL